MATSSVAPPASRRSFLGIALRIIYCVLVLLLVAAGVAVGWFYHAAHASLAQLDGTISLVELKAPVSVIRDAQGVPHITGANLQDLFFAQGYVTAQDRLWQMDLTRRAVGGEMAEDLSRLERSTTASFALYCGSASAPNVG